MPPIRPIAVWLHRYVGLVIAMFLAMAGLTGSMIAFNEDLSALASPELHNIRPPTPGAHPIDPLSMRERALALGAKDVSDYVYLNARPGDAFVINIEGAAKPQVALDPYTGAIIRRVAGPTFAERIMPFVYEFHYSLALGEWGIWIMGLVALLWTIDCFVGGYLTFPIRRVRRGSGDLAESWLNRWRPSWMMRRRATAYKTTFDFYRAGGLWLWAALFVFAWSSVGFNLIPVYTPVMRAVLSFKAQQVIPALSNPQAVPGLPWRTALATARRSMRAELDKRGLKPGREFSLAYDPSTATFTYYIWSSADRADRRNPSTSLTFNANTGAPIAFSSTREEKPGDCVERWLFDLHMGKVWGRPYDIFLAVLGLGIASLSVTGIVIWAKKRRARIAARQKRALAKRRVPVDSRSLASSRSNN